MAAIAGYYVAFSVTTCFGHGLSRGLQAGFPDGQTIALIPVAEASGLAKGLALLPDTEASDDRTAIGLATGIALAAPPTPSQFNEGFALGSALGGAVAAAPTLSNITPDPLEDPGSPGAFSIDFRTARRTPITFDVGGIGTSALTIEVSFADRNERYVVLSVDGTFCWPFDVPADNSLVGDHVTLLPRGGWPPTVVRLLVATSTEAT